MNNILAQGNDDGIIRIWDITNGRCLLTLDGENGHKKPVTRVKFIYNFIITSAEDGFVKHWDFSSGKFFSY